MQAPTKYKLAISVKTAKALGLEIPATPRAGADGRVETDPELPYSSISRDDVATLTDPSVASLPRIRGLVCRFNSICEELMTRLSGMVIT